MHQTGHVLTVDSLRVRYPNGALGILDISLSVSRGQVVAVLGGNGAGKTTTVRAITGFLRSERSRVISGHVTIFGTDVTNWEPHRVSALGVGYVAERRKVFANLTVIENLFAVGRLPEKHRRSEVLDYIFALFPILAERRAALAGRLSGGQQQMLAIARALIREPALLIVDEMTLGLHHSLQPPLFEAIRKISARGTAVVIVDESAGFVLDVSDYCYLIGAGRILEEGKPDRFHGKELLIAGYVGVSS